jgi:hypothetical protein
LATKAAKRKPASSSASRKSVSFRPRFIVNEGGERVEVVLPISVYEQLIDEIEDLQDIRDARVARREEKWESLAEVKRRLAL